MKHIVAIISVICLMSVPSVFHAQKLGHINGQDLIEHMPEYEAANKALTEFALPLQNELDKLKKQYQDDIAEYQANQNTWPKAVLDSRVQAIQLKEQQIYELEQTAMKDVE